MRTVRAEAVSRLISDLCIEANIRLRPDVINAIRRGLRKEKKAGSRRALKMLLENAAIAADDSIAVCQDTGMAAVFMEIGQDVSIKGGPLRNAVNKGIADGYKRGYLRKSIVRSPLDRMNTGTNAPAVIHEDIVPGDKIRIWVMPKGFGSENKSAIAMLEPGADEKEIIHFILEAVKKAGPEACPPYVLGIGIGGTFEYAAYLAKKALLRRIDRPNPDNMLYKLEKKILKSVNGLSIGPMGVGGSTTALAVNILTYPTHIAGLPVAVNISCHATRIAYGVL